MKTAKITKIVNTKPFTNSYGTTIYHQLQMDNGDKIEIGKKKELKEGWELTYEITDEGFEYQKAKSVQPPPTQHNGTPVTSFESKGLNVQPLIVAQSCISSACTLYQQSSDASPEKVLKAAQLFFDWAMEKGK